MIAAFARVACRQTVLRYAPGGLSTIAQCSRRAERHGFCWQHHPMRVKRERDERIRKSGWCPTCGQRLPQEGA